MVVCMTMGVRGGRGHLGGQIGHSKCVLIEKLTKTVSLVALEVYNLKSLCFTIRSFLVCLCDPKKAVLAKKWTINKIICFHSKTVLLVFVSILCFNIQEYSINKWLLNLLNLELAVTFKTTKSPILFISVSLLLFFSLSLSFCTISLFLFNSIDLSSS